MADKRYSVVLSAKEQVSQAFESAGKASTRLKKSIGETNAQLKEMGATSKRASDFDGLEKAMAGTKKSLTDAQKAARDTGTSIAQLKEEQTKYRGELKKSEQQLEKMRSFMGPMTPAQQAAAVAATDKVTDLRRSLKDVGSELNKTQKTERVATAEVKKLTDTLGSQGRRLGSLSRDLTGAGVNTKALGAEQVRLKRQADDATAAMGRQQTRLKTIGDAQSKMASNKQTRQGLVGETFKLAASTAPAIYAAKKAIDYEDAFTDVKKVVTFGSEAEERSTKSDMMRMAAEYGINQVGMAEIVASAGASGIGQRDDGTTDTKELLRFAGDAAQMSVAFDMTADEAGTTMAKQRSAMGLSQDQVISLADFTNKVADTVSAAPKEIAEVMMRQGATAMKAGFSDKQTAALAGALISTGETVETTSTAIKNIAGRLGKGHAATGAQKNALSMLGIDPQVLAKDMQRDAEAALNKVFEKIGGLSADKQAPVISQLFGEESVGAVSKLLSNMGNLRKTFGLAGDEAAWAGSMVDEYQNKAATRKAMLDRAGSQFERLTIIIGDMLLPVVDEVIKPITEFAQAGAELLETSEAARSAAGWVIKIGAGLVALKAGHIVFKGIASIFSDMYQLGRIGKAKMGGRLDRTTLSTERNSNLAARGLARVNAQLARMGTAGGMGGRAGGGRRRGRGRNTMGGAAGPTSRRGSRVAVVRGGEDRIAQAGASRRGGRVGRAGRGAGLLSLGAGLMMVPELAAAGEMLGPITDAGAGVGSLASSAGMLGAMGRMGGKLIRPLGMIGTGSELFNAAKAGDTVSAAGSAGDLAGSMGGGWAGAAAGAAIGTMIMPVIGTAIGAAAGGLLGSMAGGELGGLLGESIGGWLKKDKTAAIDGGKPITETVINESKKEVKTENHFTLKFDVKASGDPAQDNALAEKVKEMLAQALPSLVSSSMAMDSRQDASLTGLASD
ncbi:MAG: phage tail tape measure protein [Candidatus Oceanisphaera merdipullorum]|nr:phage tail tape measure protein [Candidatus Oceanisphaera merdipullorum]